MEPRPSDLVVFEHDKEFVLEAFRSGEFDSLEVVSEVVERDFFQFLRSQKILQALAQSYPTPRVKEEVPVWFYLAADMALRLHGRHSFHSFPFVVRSSGLLSLLGPEGAQRRVNPETGDLHLQCSGFNGKNHYQRETPCDADFLRKLARDTGFQELEAWFAHALPQELKKRRVFDPEGIFIGDGSYLFVPDNPAYEGSVRMWFDEHNHPVKKEDVPQEKQARLTLRRCYKMVTLLHTNRARDFFFYVGVKVVSGKSHESPVLYGMVEEFIKAVGRGVMKLLILDRGFLDGEAIGLCRRKYRIDILIPLKKNMDLFGDVMGLARSPDARWQDESPPPPVTTAPASRPEPIVRRELKRRKTIESKRPAPVPAPKRSVFGIRRLTSWASCPIPLNVVVNREVAASGEEDYWALATTREYDHPASITALYGLRTTIEERHRQLKCFQDLTSFRSRSFALVDHQVVFTLLTYTLLQWQLLRQERAALNRKTLPRVREQRLPAAEQVVLYYRQRFALLDVYEYQELLLTLKEPERLKILRKTQELRRAMYELPGPRRTPP